MCTSHWIKQNNQNPYYHSSKTQRLPLCSILKTRCVGTQCWKGVTVAHNHLMSVFECTILHSPFILAVIKPSCHISVFLAQNKPAWNTNTLTELSALPSHIISRPHTPKFGNEHCHSRQESAKHQLQFGHQAFVLHFFKWHFSFWDEDYFPWAIGWRCTVKLAGFH